MSALRGRSAPDRLWACYRCELIGSRALALDHKAHTMHEVAALDDETSASVRELWRAEGDPRGDADSSLLRGGERVE